MEELRAGYNLLLTEIAYVVKNRMLVEIWKVKVILVRFHMEMRNKILESERKVTLFVKWQKMVS